MLVCMGGLDHPPKGGFERGKLNREGGVAGWCGNWVPGARRDPGGGGRGLRGWAQGVGEGKCVAIKGFC
jgi:hypothetical protein